MRPDPPVSVEFPAWGGLAVVAVTDPSCLTDAQAAVQEVIAEVDLACSSYRDDSELAALNGAGGHPIASSPLLAEHVAASLRAAHLTDGDVDPTVGDALLAFNLGPERGSGEPIVIRAVPGYQTVAVDRDAGTIRLGRGVRLDLGATAKALAADQAVARAAAAIGPDAGVLVSLSGDLSIAGPPPPGGWRVRVTDDHRSGPDAPGQTISLSTGGLATSSTTVRGHGEGAERVHHVIDPATGTPARVHFRTVSVAAASCLDANIASTAAIVRGERAVAWLESLGLPSRLVDAGGSVQHVAGWPEDGEELPSATATALTGTA